MEPTRSSRAGSRNSDAYSPENADSLRFEEEIQSLMLESTPVNGSSFTALLGLPPPQAVELLHSPAISYRETPLDIPPGCSPTFPSNAVLVDRAARFSVFAAEVSPEISNSGEVSPENMKVEPSDSGGNGHRTAGKRKEADKSKERGSAKKSRSAEEVTGGDQKLPYVHVRARRGQATDSHSLAERARREKINARMKLLQELVPGCSKISGTALVLDEIINHVQSLQRQVEFLSMRLAAVNPRVDFELDSSLSTECGRLMVGGGPWLDGILINGGKQPQQNYHQLQQNWLIDHQHQHQQQQQPQQVWESDDTQHSHVFVGNPNTTTSGIFNYDSSTPNSVSLPNQLKTEM